MKDEKSDGLKLKKPEDEEARLKVKKPKGEVTCSRSSTKSHQD